MFDHYLHSYLSFPSSLIENEASHLFEWSLIIVSIVVLVLCIVYTYRRFAVKQILIPEKESQQTGLVRIANNKFYIDELYESIIVKPLSSIGSFFYKIIDIKLIDGLVNSVSKGLTAGSGVLRLMQSGYVGFYIFAMVFGIIAILLFNLILN